MIGWWALLRSSGAVLGSVLRAVPPWGWTLALGIALGAVGHAKLTQDPLPRQGITEIEYRDRPLTEQDLFTPTAPNRITQFAHPDSQNTRTDCITVPSWLDAPLQSRGGPAKKSSRGDGPTTTDSSPGDSGGVGLGNLNANFLSTDGPPYVITPMTDGRPSLSVSPRRVRLSAILPTNGAGRIYEWRVPTADNRVGVGLSADVWGEALSVSVEARYERALIRAGPVSIWGHLGAGYRQATLPTPMTGPYGTVGVEVELSW